MTLLVSLLLTYFVTIYTICNILFDDRHSFTILRKIAANFREVSLKVVPPVGLLAIFRQNSLKVPLKEVNL